MFIRYMNIRIKKIPKYALICFIWRIIKIVGGPRKQSDDYFNNELCLTTEVVFSTIYSILST